MELPNKEYDVLKKDSVDKRWDTWICKNGHKNDGYLNEFDGDKCVECVIEELKKCGLI